MAQKCIKHTTCDKLLGMSAGYKRAFSHTIIMYKIFISHRTALIFATLCVLIVCL